MRGPTPSRAPLPPDPFWLDFTGFVPLSPREEWPDFTGYVPPADDREARGESRRPGLRPPDPSP